MNVRQAIVFLAKWSFSEQMEEPSILKGILLKKKCIQIILNGKESRLSKSSVKIFFSFVSRSMSRNEKLKLETFSFFNSSS